MFSMRKETTVIDDDPVAWQDRRQIDLAQSYQVREYLERRAGFVRGIELPGARTPEIR